MQKGRRWEGGGGQRARLSLRQHPCMRMRACEGACVRACVRACVCLGKSGKSYSCGWARAASTRWTSRSVLAAQ